MRSSTELSDLFFQDLKKFNSNNFNILNRCDLSENIYDARVYKSFSSVITRFFIFAEKHTDLTEYEIRLLYFKLEIDMIAKYFSMFLDPGIKVDWLRPFQNELRNFIERSKNRDG